jgi:putative redox protein
VREDDRVLTDIVPGPGQVLVTETPEGHLTQLVRTGPHEWTADEPVGDGGDDAGPAPYAMLGAALGACVSMTLRLYVDRKGWPVEAIAVLVDRERVTVAGEGEAAPRVLDRFVCTLTIAGDLTEEQRERMRQIADRCPVHRTLERGSLFDTRLAP